jgi:hypothetical protein
MVRDPGPYDLLFCQPAMAILPIKCYLCELVHVFLLHVGLTCIVNVLLYFNKIFVNVLLFLLQGFWSCILPAWEPKGYYHFSEDISAVKVI